MIASNKLKSFQKIRVKTIVPIVGIGTTAPGALLDLRGIAGTFVERYSATTTGAGYEVGLNYYLTNDPTRYGLNLSNSGIGGAIVWENLSGANRQTMTFSDGSGSQTIFGLSTSSDTGATYNPRFVVQQDGNVGIGTTNPGQRLEVFNGSTTGTYTTTGWTHVSDRRLKHDIEPLENSLDKILQLRGVEYKFNNDPQNKTQIGFIAQEVEPIFPEVVLTDKKGLKSMVYSNLVAPLVEAIKEINKRTTELFNTTEGHSREIASVKAENVQLKARADKAEKENATIKARLDKIERALNGPKLILH